MVNLAIIQNALHLETDLRWLEVIIRKRISIEFNVIENNNIDENTSIDFTPPILQEPQSHYSSFISEFNLDIKERLMLILSLAPHIHPGLFDLFLIKNKHTDKIYTCLGGTQNPNSRAFLPTLETYLFIVAGSNLSKRLQLISYFSPEHFFFKHRLLASEMASSNEPVSSGVLSISPEVLQWCTEGTKHKPSFGSGFPAREITTELEWNDLILDERTRGHINDLLNWLKFREVLMNDEHISRKTRKGYKALFYGPPGTGKTLTACLLGKETDKPVFRIDLSMVVSKYIGETEKNLSKLFDKAEHADWILFFDEADSLFGSRTRTESSNDRYANQEVSYLLQRIEDFPGIAILSSNLKSNIDSAFTRRFNSIVYFPFPKDPEKLSLWRSAFPPSIKLEPDVILEDIAKDYSLTGANINNIVNNAIVQHLADASKGISLQHLRKAIGIELVKEGKTS